MHRSLVPAITSLGFLVAFLQVPQLKAESPSAAVAREAQLVLKSHCAEPASERIDDARALADEVVSVAEGKFGEMDRDLERRQYRDDNVTWAEEQEFKARKRNLRNVISKAKLKRSRLSH